jgi:CPA1 family monovalent cation:H+ antiporter
LRGGISIALALSLPPGNTKTILLTATYIVVLFSVIVQGGSVGRLIARVSGEADVPLDDTVAGRALVAGT